MARRAFTRKSLFKRASGRCAASMRLMNIRGGAAVGSLAGLAAAGANGARAQATAARSAGHRPPPRSRGAGAGTGGPARRNYSVKGNTGRRWRVMPRRCACNPSQAEYHFGLAVAALRADQRGLVEPHLLEAARLKPEYAAAQDGLGQWYILAGDLAKALHHSAAAIRLEPQNQRLRDRPCVRAERRGPGGRSMGGDRTAAGAGGRRPAGDGPVRATRPAAAAAA